LSKIFLERHTINSNPRFANDLVTVGAEGSLLLVATCLPPRPHPRPRVYLMAGSLLLLLVVLNDVITGSPPLVVVITAAGSFLLQRSRCQRCSACHAERGVARVSAKWCSLRHCVGELRGTKARGRKRRWQREGRVGGDCMREASFPTNLARVGLCGP
jgi:hypothetical protein